MLKSILGVAGFGLLVQLLGFVKLLIVADFYGVGLELDAYYLALILPTLFLGVVGGGLQSSFMPVYGELRAGGYHEKADLLQNQVLSLLLLALLPVAVLVAGCSDFFVSASRLSRHSDSELAQLASSALTVLVFSFVLNVLIDFWGLVANSHGRFVVVVLAPVVNIAVSSLAILVVPSPGLGVLVWGLMAGLLAQVLLMCLLLGRSSPLVVVSRLRVGLLGGEGELRKVLGLFLPALLGVAVTNANFAIDQAMASLVGVGSLSVLNYASRFHNVVVQSGIMAVSVVLLPRFIVLVAEREDDRLFFMLRHLLWGALFLGVGLLVFVGLMGEWFLNALLGFTALGGGDINEIFVVWFCYTVGVFATAMCVFYVKLYQAWQMPGFISLVAIVSLVLNVLLNWLLIPSYGVAGIAVATSLVYLIALLVYLLVARRVRLQRERLCPC